MKEIASGRDKEGANLIKDLLKSENEEISIPFYL